MKPKLIILSDVWGKEKADWVLGYVELLKDKFVIQYYDCCELGCVDKTIYTQEILHNQFLNGGIEMAVANLLQAEKNKINILAFSIGGTIAWKAALKGLKVNKIVAISSTRLRYETQVPNCKIKLYFGEKDIYKPDASWFQNYKIIPEINKNKTHQMYLEKDFIHLVCAEVFK
jgi:poly(3-hydroxyalkanoate) synthetase